MFHRGSLVVSALVLWASSVQGVMPEIIAHRGASHDAPENTLASFTLAWKQNADGIEGDFRLTTDGRIICSHDPTTKRTGDRSLEVKTSSFDELRQIDAGIWKGAGWKGEKMPSIEEVLAVVPQGKKIFIEIYTPQTVPILQRAIENSGLRSEQVVVISFDRETVAAARNAMAKIKSYWLVSMKVDKTTGVLKPSAEEILAVLKATQADGVDCSGSALIDAAFVNKIKSAGFELHVWTIDDAGAARKFAGLGVDSITTNRPQWIREQLSADVAKPPVAR